MPLLHEPTSSTVRVRSHCKSGLSVIAVVSLVCRLPDRGFAEPAQPELTPNELADRIDASMQRYQSVDFEAEFEDRKDPTRKKDWITVPGRFRYRSDGARFYAEENGFSIRFGTKELSERKWAGGFDGFVNHRMDQESVYLGEESTAGVRKSAVDTIFGTDNNASYVVRNIRTRECRFLDPVELAGTKCLVIQAVLKRGGSVYRSVYSVAPDRGWLPLKSERYSSGKLLITKTLSDLRQVDGRWVPRRININREASPIPYETRELRITRCEFRSEFADAEFQPRIGPGVTVFDRLRGYPWHADPWWQELGPWMKAEFGWPMGDMKPLTEMVSFTEKLNGKRAPEIKPAAWINGDPGPWSRPGRKVTVLFFFGGRAINPTPEWLGAVRRLRDEFEDTGLDVVAIATADDELQVNRVRQTVRELNIDFPVAVDQDNGSSWGQTFEAYGLPTYMGVMLVDHKGIVHTLDQRQAAVAGNPWKTPSLLQTSAEKLLQAAGVEKLPEFELYDDNRLYKNHDKIKAHWRQLAGKAVKDGVITGTITSSTGPFEGVAVQIQPKLILSSSNTGHGFLHITDRSRTMKMTTGADGRYRFENLPKGYYAIQVSAPGRADVKQDLAIDASFNPVQFNVPLLQGDTIVGKVIDADGRPVIGIKVTSIGRHVDDNNPRRITSSFPLVTAITGTDGQFVFSKLQGGSYALEVEHEKTGKTRVNFVAAGSTTAVIQLPDPNRPIDEPETPAGPLNDPEALVSALIIDAKTRRPVPLVRVIAGTEVGSSHVSYWQASTIREARNGRLQWKKKGSPRRFRLRFEADGYVPFVTDWITTEQKQRQFLVRLQKDEGLNGQVLTPGGKPAAGATLTLLLNSHGVQLENGVIAVPDRNAASSLEEKWAIPRQVTTDARGRFALPTEVSPAGVYVAHETGVADLLYKDVVSSQQITLRAWGTVHGRVQWIDRPGKSEPVTVSLLRRSRHHTGRIQFAGLLTTQPDGTFRLDHVPPGSIQVSRVFPLPNDQGTFLFPHVLAEIQAGEKKPVVLGGKGRAVTGRVAGLKTFENVTLRLNAGRPFPEFIANGYQLVQESEIAPYYIRDGLPVDKDGLFRIENVLSARYELSVVIDGERVAHSTRILVPGDPSGESLEALDVGTIDLAE